MNPGQFLLPQQLKVVEEDEDDEELLKSTSNIWSNSLKNYMLLTHSNKLKNESNFLQQEESRMFEVAARVIETSEKKLIEMREKKEISLSELKEEEELRLQEFEFLKIKGLKEEERRMSKDKEKEERLKKQRESTKKKRDEDKIKKERDDENRKNKLEEIRLAKIIESARKSALTPEERLAEDLITALAKEKEDALNLAKKLEDDANNLLSSTTEGRGARKRKKLDQLGEEGSEFNNGRGISIGEDFDDDEGVEEDIKPRGRGRPPGSMNRTSSTNVSSQQYDTNPYSSTHFGGPSLTDQYGNLIPASYNNNFAPPPIPEGAYVGLDGLYYDSNHQPIVFSPYPTTYYPQTGFIDPRMTSPGYYGGSVGGESSSGMMYEREEELEEETGPKMIKTSKSTSSKRWRAIEDLERRVWTQIAKKDIPRVSFRFSNLASTISLTPVLFTRSLE